MDEKTAIEKGEEGERDFSIWLAESQLPFVKIAQRKNDDNNSFDDTFAPLFLGHVKRPDFFVLLASVGMIAVDVKNYKPYDNGYTLKVTKELKRSLMFERLFRVPIWYAYRHEDGGKPLEWYWLSNLKAAEVGDLRINQKTEEEFLWISFEHFEVVKQPDDLAKLYTHRIECMDKMAVTVG